jgi:hypothetical protein
MGAELEIRIIVAPGDSGERSAALQNRNEALTSVSQSQIHSGPIPAMGRGRNSAPTDDQDIRPSRSKYHVRGAFGRRIKRNRQDTCRDGSQIRKHPMVSSDREHVRSFPERLLEDRSTQPATAADYHDVFAA